jgi:hypothetical protein
VTAPRDWHQSSLLVALRCGEKYRRRYLERSGSPPPTTALIRGSAVHQAIGQGLDGQQRAGAPVPVDLYEDVAASEIDRARHGGATLTVEEASVGAAKTWGALKDAAVAYAGAYGVEVAPAIRPVVVERRVVVEAVPGLDGVRLVGTPDVVTLEADGTEMIRDDKTTERSPRSDLADKSGQLTMYALLRSLQRGTLVGRVALDHLVRDKSTGEVAHVHQPSTRTNADLHALVRRIGAVDRAVQAGIFIPAAPEDWWCSATWCEYWHDCPFAQGRQ